MQTYRKVLDERKVILGENDPDTVTTKNSIANVLFAQKKYDKALQTYQEVLDERKVILGENHSDISFTKCSIGLTLSKQGKYENAIQILKEVYEIEIRKRPNHPNTLTIKNTLADVLLEKKKYDKAL